MQQRSLPKRRYISTRCYITNSYTGKSVHLVLGQTPYTIAVCTVKSSWWTEQLSETCRVSFQNKFQKLVYLVVYYQEICHDARSHECQMFHRPQHNTEDLINEANALTTATAIQTASKDFNVPQKKSLQNTGSHTCHSLCWRFPDCSSPSQSSCPSYAALEGTQLHTSQTRLSCLCGTPLILKHFKYFVSMETQRTCTVLITNSVPDHNNTNCTVTLDHLHLRRSGNPPYHQV